MPITPAELAMVQDSLEQMQDDFEVHSTYFYSTLFQHAPHMRKMFRDDLAGQGMKFMTTLQVIVRKLDDEEGLADQYVGLGRSHAIMGVSRDDFAPMEEALMDTMRNALGDEFTAELEQAWRHAYAVVSQNMIQRGAIEA